MKKLLLEKKKLLILLAGLLALIIVLSVSFLSRGKGGSGQVASETDAEDPDTTIYQNALIRSSEDGLQFVTWDDKEYYYHTEEIADGVKLPKLKKGDVTFATIWVKDDVITKVKTESFDKTEGRVIKISESTLVLEDGSRFHKSEFFSAYDVAAGTGMDAVYLYQTGQITGFQKVEILYQKDKAIGVLVKDKTRDYSKVRVLISNKDYSGYNHKSVTLFGNRAMTVTVNGNSLTTYDKGTSLELKPEDFQVGDRIVAVPSGEASETEQVSQTVEAASSGDASVSAAGDATADDSETIRITSIDRDTGEPAYRGQLEITRNEDGFYVVNALPIEEYLYGVVSSEVPSYFEHEAQKAMAICARGYTISHINKGTYAEYGASIDDSTMCQVYNNHKETEESISAVDETKGLVMEYQGELITPYYFSTSAGVTASDSEIWGTEGSPYLTANFETEAGEAADLSDEATFESFMDDSNGLDTVEKDLQFYRWHIDFTDDEMSLAINRNLAERVSRNEQIEVLQDDGSYQYEADLTAVGKVEEIQMSRRGKGGVLMEMIVVGSEKTIRITGSTNLINIPSTKDMIIYLNDGSTLTDWDGLPSNTYYIKKTETGYKLVGGGFGHCVGLSQYGAHRLASRGHDYNFILQHYYTGEELVNIYE